MAINTSDEISLPARPARVWLALNDPEILKQSLPGCQSLERTGEHSFSAVAKLKIGAISATFKGSVELADIDAPYGCTIRGAGEGGIAGFARGTARVQLQPENDGTLLLYTVHAEMGGKIAQLGARLIDSVMKKLSQEFFRNFSDVLVNNDPSIDLISGGSVRTETLFE